MYYIQKADKPTLIEQKFNQVKLKEDKILLPIKENKLKENKLKINKLKANNLNKRKIKTDNLKCNSIKNDNLINNDLSEKKQIKIAEKIDKLLQKSYSKKIVLSNEIKQYQVLINRLYSKNYNIVDGKKLFEAIACITLEYICQKKQIKPEETKVSVLVNDLSDYTLQNIKQLASNFKTLTIVTNHIEKFNKLADLIYNESGLMIIVSNNKKKSLTKSNIILNIDFPQELINTYNLNDEAVIVNIQGNVKINTKRFNGIIINDYEITTNTELCYDFEIYCDTDNSKRNTFNKQISNDQSMFEKKYNTKELYEAQIYDGIPYIDLMKKIKADNVQIKALYGLNGIAF